ncbi:MAG: SUMF1/EgtB/PvdO family nonheme iron enzyme [Anaerolineae bacterium]|nr:SUMF1/EgtB/PvdO family nonheme iron enzyme [Anaerolineae bacterium]
MTAFLGRTGITRVVRGGSWINTNRNARCAYRNRNNPDNRNNNIGFRVILSIASFGVSLWDSFLLRSISPGR